MLVAFKASNPDGEGGNGVVDLLEVGDDTDGLSVWELQLVDGSESGPIIVESANREMVAETDEYGNVNMTWGSISVQREEDGETLAVITVTLSVSLSGHLSNWNLGFLLESNETEIGLWQGGVLVPTTAGSDEVNGELFFPTGYGHGYLNPANSTDGMISGVYPSGGVSMQFLATVNDPSYSDASATPTSGAYVAALDMSGFIKTLEYITWDQRQQQNYGKNRNSIHRHFRDRSGLFVASDVKKVDPSLYQQRTSSSKVVSFLSISSIVENAGVPIGPGFTWSLPYSVAVGAVSNVSNSNGFPLWYQAAQLYRDFVHPAAPWLEQKISDRIPGWYR